METDSIDDLREVMDAVRHKAMADALEAYRSQHVGRCGGGDAMTLSSVCEAARMA